MSQQLSLLSVPGSDCQRFASTLSLCLLEERKVDLLNVSDMRTKFGKGDADKLGLLICEPAVRLKQSYDGLRQLGLLSVSFREFYEAPARVNYLSHQLNGIDISLLGFVGLQEAYAESFLAAEVWTGGLFKTVSPSKIIDVSRQVLATIDPQDYANIQRVHVKDYALYNQIKEEFEQRATTYRGKIEQSIVAQKTLLLHLGPPKTGTSALQSWLLNNRRQLRYSGIDYPPHLSDENGISSGNFSALLSSTPCNNWAFDDSKASQLIRQFERSDANILLLSSEHFFYSLPWLFSRFPHSQFVFYIRHPLSLLESNYHQNVKRHRGEHSFSQPDKVIFEQLSAVSDLARQFSVKVSYRYLDPSLLVNGNIIDDFLSLMSLSSESADKSKKINTQYRPGALELMRICNGFLDDHLIHELDRFLQSVSEDFSAFSLLEPERVVELQGQLAEQARFLAAEDIQIKEDKLMRLLSRYHQPVYLPEASRIEDMLECLHLLAKCKPALIASIMKQEDKCEKQSLSAFINAKRIRHRYSSLQSMATRIRHYFKSML